MTLDEFRQKVESAFPGASVEQDNYGQLIVHTGLKLAEDYSVVPMSDENE